MTTLESKELLERSIYHIPNELESEIREGLLKIGIEHITLLILSESNEIIFEAIEGLSSRISITKRVSDNLIHYLESAMNCTPGELDVSQDRVLDKRIFDHQKLSIITNNLQQYTLFETLLYGHKMIVLFHCIDPLTANKIRQLEPISDITTAWSNAWVAHNMMLCYWHKYSEPKQLSIASTLTKSEFNVLELLLKGFTGSEIASIRNVSKETVRTQIKSILNKTHCRSQNQLISRFSQAQWPISHPEKSIYS